MLKRNVSQKYLYILILLLLLRTMSEPHPISRIRKSFLDLSDESGMKKYASAAGFAKWLGRSGGLIRNVESRRVSFSMQLAKLIELKTGVSANWMLTEDAGRSRIMAKDGTPWNAADYLDPYSKGGLLSNMAVLLESKPDLVPSLVGRMVEARLAMELYLEGYLYLDGNSENSAKNKGRNTNPSYEGFTVLRDVLKAILVRGADEKQKFGVFMNEVLMDSSVDDPDRQSKRISDLMAGWNFFSMLEATEGRDEKSP